MGYSFLGPWLKWKKPRLTKLMKRESGNVLKWDVKGESLTQDLPHSFRKLAPSICQHSPPFFNSNIKPFHWLEDTGTSIPILWPSFKASIPISGKKRKGKVRGLLKKKKTFPGILTKLPNHSSVPSKALSKQLFQYSQCAVHVYKPQKKLPKVFALTGSRGRLWWECFLFNDIVKRRRTFTIP